MAKTTTHCPQGHEYSDKNTKFYQLSHGKQSKFCLRCMADKTAARRKIVRDILKEARSIPCTDCGKEFPFYCMDFDHVRGSKEFTLNYAKSRVLKMNKILEEIEKCDVVCSNCHRIRTVSRLGNEEDGKKPS